MQYKIGSLFLFCVFGFSAHAVDNAITFSQSITLMDVVQTTLDHSPNIQVQKLGVDKAKAQERMASGKFDFTTRASAGYHNNVGTNRVISQLRDDQRFKPDGTRVFGAKVPNERRVDADTQSLSAGVSKVFRMGVSTDLSLSMIRRDPRQDDRSGANPINFTLNTSILAFRVNIPFLKGGGSVSAAAQETAARLNHEASVSDFQHKITSTLLEAIKAYWDYNQSVVLLEKVQESEQRVQGWVNSIGIRDDSLQGYLEDTKGKVIDAIQAVEESQIALVNTMGIHDHQTNLGPPTTKFRLVWDNVLATFDPKTIKEKWIAQAVKNRLDLKATQLHLQAAKVQLAKARKDTLPTLNLNLMAGYNGFNQNDGFENFVDSLDSNVRGTNSSAMLLFKYPLGNNTAKGQRDLQQANYQQNLIKTNDKERTIRLAVNKEVANVYGRLKKAVQIQKTTQSYRQSVLSLQQNRAFLQDTVKLLSLIELENKFISSLENSTIAMADLMKAIAQARFQTGTLVVIGDTINDVSLENLTTLPSM
jgi:outer membrane protein